MDLATLITLGLAVGGAIATGVWWVIQKAYQALSQLHEQGRRLGGHDEEIAEMREHAEQLQERLEKTEEGVRNIGNLQNSVENMGRLFAEQLGNLAKIMGVHNENNNRRFDELNDRLNERRSFRDGS